MPRALAFENRIAAGIADPGVVDVSTSWIKSLPTPLLALLKGGRKAEFDQYLTKALTPKDKVTLNFRMRPYGFSSYIDTYTAVLAYILQGVAERIRCPLLITSPANEVYWPNQSEQLYNLVTGSKRLVRFSDADGADLHCEPNGTGIRDLHIYDWLNETLS